MPGALLEEPSKPVLLLLRSSAELEDGWPGVRTLTYLERLGCSSAMGL